MNMVARSSIGPRAAITRRPMAVGRMKETREGTIPNRTLPAAVMPSNRGSR